MTTEKPAPSTALGEAIASETLVVRLEQTADYASGVTHHIHAAIEREAATEIERLEKERDDLGHKANYQLSHVIRAEAALQRVEELAKFATHRYGCPQGKWEAGQTFIACTCGYKKALALSCDHPYPGRLSRTMDRSRLKFCHVCDEPRKSC